MAAISIAVAFKVIECASCAMPFAVIERFETDRRKDHSSFYCPAGHSNFFSHKTDEEKLREQVKDLQAAKDFEQQQRRAADAEAERLRKAVKRAKKRTANGICPCCHRTVKQMAAHMKTKHPEYVAEASK
jgi:hypothetical protein